jgi:hypothetical protein
VSKGTQGGYLHAAETLNKSASALQLRPFLHNVIEPNLQREVSSQWPHPLANQNRHGREDASEPMKHNPEYRWQNKTSRPAAIDDEGDADFLNSQIVFYDAFFFGQGSG